MGAISETRIPYGACRVTGAGVVTPPNGYIQGGIKSVVHAAAGHVQVNTENGINPQEFVMTPALQGGATGAAGSIRTALSNPDPTDISGRSFLTIDVWTQNGAGADTDLPFTLTIDKIRTQSTSG